MCKVGIHGGGRMNVMILCDQCRKTLQVPDAALGKKVCCPACQAVFVAKPKQEMEIVECVVAEEDLSPAPFSVALQDFDSAQKRNEDRPHEREAISAQSGEKPPPLPGWETTRRS